jgi:hypothetical protein
MILVGIVAGVLMEADKTSDDFVKVSRLAKNTKMCDARGTQL